MYRTTVTMNTPMRMASKSPITSQSENSAVDWVGCDDLVAATRKDVAGFAVTGEGFCIRVAVL